MGTGRQSVAPHCLHLCNSVLALNLPNPNDQRRGTHPPQQSSPVNEWLQLRSQIAAVKLLFDQHRRARPTVPS